MIPFKFEERDTFEPPPTNPLCETGFQVGRGLAWHLQFLSPGTKMEPGTILSIVDLSFSVLKLGTKIALEFWPNRSDKVPDKLKRLNDRLQQFYNTVESIVHEPKGQYASSSLVFPGADAILETLTECDSFLHQYESALRDRAPGGTGQRLALLIGPDSSRIEDLDKRILSHYPELHSWEQKILSSKQDRTLSTLRELQAS